MTVYVNKRNMEKWVKALESGRYKQGNGSLLRDGQFCCLGVACDLFGVVWVQQMDLHTFVYEDHMGNKPFGEDYAMGLPPVGLLKRFLGEGALTPAGDDVKVSNDFAWKSASAANDGGETFVQIAARLRALYLD